MWNVTFSGATVEGNVPLLNIDTSFLIGSGVTAEVTETVTGNQPRGRFMLQTDTAPRGWPEHRSGWIDVGASAASVEAAIVQIPGISAVDVNVNLSLPTVGPIAWEVTFAHRQVAVGDYYSDDNLGFVATGQSGDRPSLHVVR